MPRRPGVNYSREVVSALSGTASEGTARKRSVVESEAVSIGATWRKPLGWRSALWSYKRVLGAPRPFVQQLRAGNRSKNRR